jgi:predicted RNA-binding Zn-ribbon protein involved in translation (DUF1610 family)
MDRRIGIEELGKQSTRKGKAVLFEKVLQRSCPECGEDMHLARDYGMRGQEFGCPSCGFSEETIDLREPTVVPLPPSHSHLTSVV